MSKFYFITGSQDLYGEETLREVDAHAREIAGFLAGKLPEALSACPVVTTPEQICNVMREASADADCAGVITWMHTFSPSKMWINGLKILTKPVLHLHTQHHREIPGFTQLKSLSVGGGGAIPQKFFLAV